LHEGKEVAGKEQGSGEATAIEEYREQKVQISPLLPQFVTAMIKTFVQIVVLQHYAMAFIQKLCLKGS